MAVNVPRQHVQRGWRRWVLLGGMAWFTLSQALRLVQAVTLWSWLMEVQVWPGPAYHAVTGLIWALAGGIGLVGLWRHQRWGLRLCEVTLVTWSAWNWLDRLWVSPSPTALSNWPFALGINLVLLLVLFLITNAERTIGGHGDDEQRK